MRRGESGLVVAFALAAGLAVAGCYETPKPTCAFLCGPGAECPEDYACGLDNRCHLIDSEGALLACEEDLPPDAAIVDAPNDVAEADAEPTATDAAPDATPPDAALPDAALPDATPMHLLAVVREGSGAGTVTSVPSGIDCGTSCAAAFTEGTVVALSASPAAGSTFAGWTGGRCSGTGACLVTIESAISVTARFNLAALSVTVTKEGAGTGTVTSNPAGISCGAACSASFEYGQVITLNAAAGVGSTFTGWSGAGCSGTGSCIVTVDAAKIVNATFDLATYPLTVTKAGAGGGTVSSPGGISCGATCSASYYYGTTVNLTATPDASSYFAGWSQAGCSGTGACVVTVDAAKTVTATFNLVTHPLGVMKAGTGGGVVASTPAGIDCGATCSAPFDHGAVVSLAAAPDVVSTFAGWSGSCSGAGGCSVTVDAAKTVTATFNLATHLLVVTKSGTGGGTVTSTPAGINCGATCSALFDHGATVTLSAAPGPGSAFAGWSGAGCSGTGACVVTMTSAATVEASFASSP